MEESEETIGDGLTLLGKLDSSELRTDRLLIDVSKVLLLAGAAVSDDSSAEELVRDGIILLLSIASGLKVNRYERRAPSSSDVSAVGGPGLLPCITWPFTWSSSIFRGTLNSLDVALTVFPDCTASMALSISFGSHCRRLTSWEVTLAILHGVKRAKGWKKTATDFHYSYLLHTVVYFGVEITSFPREKAAGTVALS